MLACNISTWFVKDWSCCSWSVLLKMFDCKFWTWLAKELICSDPTVLFFVFACRIWTLFVRVCNCSSKPVLFVVSLCKIRTWVVRDWICRNRSVLFVESARKTWTRLIREYNCSNISVLFVCRFNKTPSGVVSLLCSTSSRLAKVSILCKSRVEFSRGFVFEQFVWSVLFLNVSNCPLKSLTWIKQTTRESWLLMMVIQENQQFDNSLSCLC